MLTVCCDLLLGVVNGYAIIFLLYDPFKVWYFTTIILGQNWCH